MEKTEMEKRIDAIEEYLDKCNYNEAEAYVVCSLLADKYKAAMMDNIYGEEMEEEPDEEPELSDDDISEEDEDDKIQPKKEEEKDAAKALIKKQKISLKRKKKIDDGDF